MLTIFTKFKNVHEFEKNARTQKRFVKLKMFMNLEKMFTNFKIYSCFQKMVAISKNALVSVICSQYWKMFVFQIMFRNFKKKCLWILKCSSIWKIVREIKKMFANFKNCSLVWQKFIDSQIFSQIRKIFHLTQKSVHEFKKFIQFFWKCMWI